MRRWALFALASVVLIVASCGGESNDSSAEPFPPGEPVDLVYISDSGGQNVAPRYAELAAEALDREVRLNREVEADPEAIRTSFAEEVAGAEIIVFYFRPEAFEQYFPQPNIRTAFDAIDALAGDPDYSGPEWTPGTKWEPAPVVPSAQDWQPYEDWLGEVYDAIWEVREGRPVVLRAHDIYNPWVAPWTELGIEQETTAFWEGQSRAIRETAEANGAVFVSFFDLFNGPAHDEDPREKGWIGEDGMHAGVEGGAAAAEALAAVGFEMSEPPR
jgi:hypothetical protein